MALKLQCVLMTAVAVAFVAVFGILSTTASGVALLAGTLLAMGGNSNPDGVGMPYELSGCRLSDCSSWPPGYISGAPGTHYSDYNFQIVKWSAQTPFTTGSDGTLYGDSQLDGVSKFEAALKDFYVSGTPIVGVGYSSSANVLTKVLRRLQAAHDAGQPTPSPEDLSFLVFGNPNRPNGGIFSRFAGAFLPPPIGVSFDGSTPVSDYQVTDISWQWDPASDFPTYPLNLLAVANSAIGFFTLHSVYFNADPTDSDTIVQDVTVGNTRYMLLKPDLLPLLKPLQDIGVPKPVLDLLQAPLEYAVELGYDRTISPATPTPAKWIPPLANPLEVGAGFLQAVAKGVTAAIADLTPPPATDTPSTLAAAVPSVTKSDPPQSRMSVEPTATSPEPTSTSTDTAASTKPTSKPKEPEVRESLKAVVGKTGLTPHTESAATGKTDSSDSSTSTPEPATASSAATDTSTSSTSESDTTKAAA